MARVIKKIQKFKSSAMDSAAVLDVFERIVGTKQEKMAIDIVYPKYIKYKTHIRRYFDLLKSLSKNASEGPLKTSISAFVSEFDKNWDNFDSQFGYSEAEISFNMCDYTKLTEKQITVFATNYYHLKESDLIKHMLFTCQYLMPYRKKINDKDLTLLTSAGSLFTPFKAIPELNFKFLYYALGADNQPILMKMLAQFTKATFGIYELYMSPDYDLSDIIDYFTKQIKEAKKRIPRCNEAFDEIMKHIDLLRDNFSMYYAKYKMSGNGTIILEEFVQDVIKKTDKGSPSIMLQFKTIVETFKKEMASNPKMRGNKNATDLFGELDKSFKADEALASDSKVSDDLISLDTDTMLSKITAEVSID